MSLIRSIGFTIITAFFRWLLASPSSGSSSTSCPEDVVDEMFAETTLSPALFVKPETTFAAAPEASAETGSSVTTLSADDVTYTTALPPAALVELLPFDPSTRVEPAVAVYSRRLLAHIGPMLTHGVGAQATLDADYAAAAPRLSQDGEYMVDQSGLHLLPIGPLLFRTRTAVIFAARNDPKKVVKYQHNCDDVEEVHALVREYIFLRKLQGAGVVPHVYFLSPPVRFPASISLKSDFEISDDQRAACAADAGSHIRFMVMERAETSLDALAYDINRAGRRVPVVEAIKVMIHALLAIEGIHAKGVIHGDIHWGNLVLLNRGGQQELRLIDFGNAMFADEMELHPVIVRVPGSYNHCYFSHWNLAGYRYAYRDDVFKALLVGAFLIHGPKYSAYCVGLESDPQGMMLFKRDSFLFAMPNRDLIAEMQVDPETRRVVRQQLSNALALARSVDHVDARPDYAAIVAELNNAVDAIQVAQAFTAGHAPGP